MRKITMFFRESFGMLSIVPIKKSMEN